MNLVPEGENDEMGIPSSRDRSRLNDIHYLINLQTLNPHKMFKHTETICRLLIILWGWRLKD